MVSERSSFKEAEQFPNWIIIPVSYSFLEGNDRVVRDCDMFGANRGATLCDITETDPLMFLEIVYPVFNVEGMHLQRRGVNHVPGTCEFVVECMFSKYMADILTQETLDAFPELLDPVNIALIDPPGSIGSIRWPRLELSDLFLYGIINRNIRDEVPDGWKCFHWLDGHGFIRRQIAHACHTHQPRAAVDLRRTGTTFSSLAIPAYSQVVSRFGLDLMDGVQDNHSFGNISDILAEFAAGGSGTPDLEVLFGHACHVIFYNSAGKQLLVAQEGTADAYFISSTISCRSGRRSAFGTFPTCMLPSVPLTMLILTFPSSGLFSGKSSRK